MNRAFPGDPAGSITSRIAHFVSSCLFPQVDVVIDLHSAGDGMEFALAASFHHVEDVAQRSEIQEVAVLFDTPFVLCYTSEMPGGLLTEEAERLGKIAIGGEFGHSAGVSVRGVRHAYKGIKNVLKHYHNLAGSVEKIDPDREEPPLLVAATGLEEYIPAPSSGVYEPLVEVGTRVARNQVVGLLHDFEHIDSESLQVRSPRDGWVIMQPFRVPTRKGSTMLVVAREVADEV